VGQSWFPFQYYSVTIDYFLPTYGLSDHAAEQSDGTVPPSLFNCEQNNWVELLPLAEFANNNSVHHSMLITLLGSKFNCYSMIQLKPPMATRRMFLVQADSWMTGMDMTYRILQENIPMTDVPVRMYAGWQEVTLAIEYQGWLSIRNWPKSRTLNKLVFKFSALNSASTINTNTDTQV